MRLWQTLRRAGAARRRNGPAHPAGQAPQRSPKPETPYRRRYTRDRSFEELVRRAHEKGEGR